MKNKLFILAIICLAFVVSAKAQSNGTNAPSTLPTFFQSAENYFTSFNTNYTFTNVKVDFETGYKQVTGVNAASFATLNYYATTNFEVEGSIQFSGVGSAVNSGEAGLGYALINHYDARLTVDLLGGYDDIQHAVVIEPKLEIKKKLTTNTFASIGVSMPYYFRHTLNTNPTFWTGVGFTF